MREMANVTSLENKQWNTYAFNFVLVSILFTKLLCGPDC